MSSFDFHASPLTSKRLSSVRSSHGSMETKLAKALWHRGIRYRRNYKKLPGSPDIAITKYKIAIFVDGEFWHGYDWDNAKNKIKKNKEYWVRKIEKNMERDIKNDILLKELNWLVLHFWINDLQKFFDGCVNDILDVVLSRMKNEM